MSGTPVCPSCIEAYKQAGGDMDKFKFPEDREGFDRRHWLEKYGTIEKEKESLDKWL